MYSVNGIHPKNIVGILLELLSVIRGYIVIERNCNGVPFPVSQNGEIFISARVLLHIRVGCVDGSTVFSIITRLEQAWLTPPLH